MESARLAATAYHKPEQIDQEREHVYRVAAPAVDDTVIIDRALRMAHDVAEGAVLS